MKIWALVVVLLTGSVARVNADPSRGARARQLFADGRAAFDNKEYDHAYDLFKQSYLLSQRPELLFNMSRALELGDKPHDAAESLRAYLRTVPKTDKREEIEQRILTLEESQRIIDAENAKNAAPVVAPAPAPVVVPVAAEPMTPPPEIVAAPPPPKKSHRNLAIGLGVAGGVVVLAGVVVLGVLLSQSTPGPTASTFGSIRVTP